jgi:hypothetical protein
MSIIEGKERLALIVTIFLSVLIMGGCATTIKYSYDMKISFSERKSYMWTPSSVQDKQDPLLETNVQVLADQLLAQKGFTRVSENADLMISMSCESDTYKGSYQLRTLTLSIYKMPKENTTEKKELVWRGTAFGTIFGNINTDAASGDLKKAVQGILSRFPPK